jgi:hypothetical protein
VFQTSSVRACARTCVVAWLSRTGRGRHPALSQAFVRRSDPCGNYSRSRTLTNTNPLIKGWQEPARFTEWNLRELREL